MIKTVNLTAGIEMAVELMGGYHCCIENRGSGVIYASKTSSIIADSDGVTAIDSGNSKVLRNIAQYKKDDNSSYDYYGKIYLLSDSDGKVEIQTANDLNFFSRKNSAKGGGTGTYDDTAIKSDITDLQTGKADKSDVYTKTETNNALNTKVDKVENMGLSANNYTTTEKNKLAGIETNANKTVVDTALSSISTNPVQNKIINSAIKNVVALTLSSAGLQKKNLLKNTLTTRTVSGVTFTVNEDKSITVNGTATSDIWLPISTVKKSSYRKGNLRFTTGNSYTGNMVIYCSTTSNGSQFITGGGGGIYQETEKYPNDTTEKYVYEFYIKSGTSFDNVVFYPMVRYADITDGTYEPYTDDLQTQINAILARLDSAGI